MVKVISAVLITLGLVACGGMSEKKPMMHDEGMKEPMSSSMEMKSMDSMDSNKSDKKKMEKPMMSDGGM